jgi:hypothetical protein
MVVPLALGIAARAAFGAGRVAAGARAAGFGRLVEAVERKLAERPASATGSVVEGIRSIFG